MRKNGIFSRLFGKPGEGRPEDDFGDERREMIRGVHELSETTVKEVMVPRIDVLFLPVDAAEKEIVERVSESGHSRIPIYRDTIDNVIGVLYVKDLIRAALHGEDIRLDAIIRKPYFVPESKRIDSLLREFRRRHLHIAVAVDEYGGTSGIVCLEDILEVIVGEIQDEFDNEREDILAVSEGVWICDGRVNLADLKQETGIDLEPQEFDTLGGYVFDLFGKIPVKYEKMSRDGIDFIIQDMDGHKINTVKIVRRPKPEEGK
jgi:CBS domain containing-hemolysin-like protein